MSTAVVAGIININSGSAPFDELALKVYTGLVLGAYNKKTVTEGRHIMRNITSGKSAQFPAIGRATTVLRGHAVRRRSVQLPSVIIVLTSLLALLVEFLIEIVIVIIAIFVFYHHAIPVTVLLLPWLIVLQFLMAAGLMLALSVISVLYYDVEHAMPAIMRLLFFLSPIFYPVSMIPENLRAYFYLNPFTGLLELFHLTLYEGKWPSWEMLGAVTVTSLVSFFVGFWIFHRFEDTCVEIA